MAALGVVHASCVHCGNTQTSRWRGPNKDLCSNNKCKAIAEQAFAEMKDNEKDRRIDELVAMVRKQATTIAVLRAQLEEAQQKPIAVPMAIATSSATTTAHGSVAEKPAPKRPALTNRTNSTSGTAHPNHPSARRRV